MTTTTYIHYGSDNFNPDLFVPIQNCNWKPKPADGTGLWASREGQEIYHGKEYAGQVYPDGRVVYGWKEWCEDNDFNMDRLKTFFCFQLKPDANVITLKEPSDLIPLPKTTPWKPKDNSELLSLPAGRTPSLEQLEEFYKPNPCFLDYEKMAAEGVGDGRPVDAIELQNSHLFRDCLNTWDCDCIVIMNPNVIVEV